MPLSSTHYLITRLSFNHRCLPNAPILTQLDGAGYLTSPKHKENQNANRAQLNSLNLSLSNKKLKGRSLKEATRDCNGSTKRLGKDSYTFTSLERILFSGISLWFLTLCRGERRLSLRRTGIKNMTLRGESFIDQLTLG